MQQGQVIQTSSFFLEDLKYFPVGAHNPMLARPYVVEAHQNVLSNIGQAICETGVSKINKDVISPHVHGILQHSAMGYATPIDSGWVSTARFAFLLTVRHLDNDFGIEKKYYIHGFTNHDGITDNGAVDTNMVHTINNIIETTVVTHQTPTGLFREEKLTMVYNVMASAGGADFYAQRPQDVIDNINTLGMRNIMQSVGGDITSANINGFMTQFNNNTCASLSDNAVPTEYLSRLINAGVQQNRARDMIINTSFSVTDNDTSRQTLGIDEPLIRSNAFLRYMFHIAGFRVVGHIFSFSNLMTIDNTIYSRCEKLNITKSLNFVTNNTPDVGDHWNGQDIVTLKAHSIIESAVAIATRYGFSELVFQATNMDNPMGHSNVYITHYASLTSLPPQQITFLCELFKTAFITGSLIPESQGGAIPFDMTVYVDVLKTTKIFLSYGGYPGNWFTIPTIANSSFASTMTVNADSFNMMSHNLGVVIDTISNNQQSQSPIYY